MHIPQESPVRQNSPQYSSQQHKRSRPFQFPEPVSIPQSSAHLTTNSLLSPQGLYHYSVISSISTHSDHGNSKCNKCTKQGSSYNRSLLPWMHSCNQKYQHYISKPWYPRTQYCRSVRKIPIAAVIALQTISRRSKSCAYCWWTITSNATCVLTNGTSIVRVLNVLNSNRGIRPSISSGSSDSASPASFSSVLAFVLAVISCIIVGSRDEKSLSVWKFEGLEMSTTDTFCRLGGIFVWRLATLETREMSGQKSSDHPKKVFEDLHRRLKPRLLLAMNPRIPCRRALATISSSQTQILLCARWISTNSTR